MQKRKTVITGSVEHVLDMLSKVPESKIGIAIESDKVISTNQSDFDENVVAITGKDRNFWDSFRTCILHNIAKGGGVILLAHKSTDILNVVHEISTCVMETGRVDQMFQIRESGAIENMRGYDTGMSLTECVLNNSILIVNCDHEYFLDRLLGIYEHIEQHSDAKHSSHLNMIVMNVSHTGTHKKWVKVTSEAKNHGLCILAKLDIAEASDTVDDVYQHVTDNCKFNIHARNS